MKVSVDDQELFTLTDFQKQVIKYIVPEEFFDEDMKRRLHWILMHKYEHTFRHMRAHWTDRLKERGMDPDTMSNEEFAERVFAQPDYMNYSLRQKADWLALQQANP